MNNKFEFEATLYEIDKGQDHKLEPADIFRLAFTSGSVDLMTISHKINFYKRVKITIENLEADSEWAVNQGTLESIGSTP